MTITLYIKILCLQLPINHWNSKMGLLHIPYFVMQHLIKSATGSFLIQMSFAVSNVSYIMTIVMGF